MVTADPLGGDTPYEVLGAKETDTLETIEERYEKVFIKYRDQKRAANQNNDNQAFKEANAAIKEISKAWKWIEDNHEPPAADRSVDMEVLTDDPRVGDPISLKVTGDGDPVETPVRAIRDGTEISAEQTGSDGTVEFTVRSHGPVQFTASTTDAYDDETAVVTVDRKRVDLAFDSPPTASEIDETVSFTVLADGSPEPNVVVETDSTALGTTGSDGTVSHAFGDVDTKTITARKPDDDAATYEGCETDLDVSPETVDMAITGEAGDQEIGDTATVHVYNSQSGGPIENADVTVGDESGSTDDTGVVELPLTETGEVTIRATKSTSDGDIEYGDARATLSVSKQQRSLTIESIEGKRMENAELTVSVIDDAGDPLEGAVVATNWGHSEETNADGEATLQLNDDGSLKIEASKETDEVSFDPAMQVERIGEFTRELVIEQAPNLADPDSDIEIVVADNTGQPVPGAEVTCDKQIGETWTTDADGKATIPLLDRVGNRRITVKKDEGDFDDKVRTNVRVL
jgi:protocatechuate 3,4-dioxygenase beta subunit